MKSFFITTLLTILLTTYAHAEILYTVMLHENNSSGTTEIKTDNQGITTILSTTIQNQGHNLNITNRMSHEDAKTFVTNLARQQGNPVKKSAIEAKTVDPISHYSNGTVTDNKGITTQIGRFIDNSDGTVTDTVTGLMWKKCSENHGGPDCKRYDLNVYNWWGAFQLAVIDNSGGGFAGYKDWRVPNINEISSINPSKNLSVFPNTQSGTYWSSSPYGNNGDLAWRVHSVSGEKAGVGKEALLFVRLVRGGGR